MSRQQHYPEVRDLSLALRRALRVAPARAQATAALVVTALATSAAPATAAFPPEFSLAKLLPAGGGDGSLGFVLTGIAARNASGSAVSGAGDVNGDGIGDLVVGAPGACPGGLCGSGQSYVVFGRAANGGAAFPAILQLARLLPAQGGDGSAGFALNGIATADQSGAVVSKAGDLNHDGIDDLVVGAPYGSAGAGEAYVVFGRNVAQSGAFPAVLQLSSLSPEGGGDGSNGFVVEGIAADDHAGRSVAGAGDFNGDGIDDLIVGAPTADPPSRNRAGECFVVFGRETTHAGNFPARFELRSLLPDAGGDGSAGVAFLGFNANSLTGFSVSGAGDVNDDGISDVIMGAFLAKPNGTESGRSYIVFGRDTVHGDAFPAVLPLSALLSHYGGDGSLGFALNGIYETDAGRSVAAAGDVNGDGIDDVVIGGGRHAGVSYVVFGRNPAQSGAFPAEFDLYELRPNNGGDGSEGFVANGVSDQDYSGAAVAAAGDINGDGIADLLIGARGADPGGRSSAGASYVVFGRDTAMAGNFPANVNLRLLLAANGGDGSAGFALNGIDAGDQSGFAVGRVGDINGDGIDDLVVGAPRAAAAQRSYAGESYVVFGRAATP